MDMNRPLDRPPPGVTPNYVDPESLAPVLVACITTCLVLMIIFVGMRLYTKLFISRAFGRDDCMSSFNQSSSFTQSFQMLAWWQR